MSTTVRSLSKNVRLPLLPADPKRRNVLPLYMLRQFNAISGGGSIGVFSAGLLCLMFVTLVKVNYNC